MERRKSEEITDVLRRFIREYGLESPLNEYRLKGAWYKMMGEKVSRYTDDLFIRNQVLYVRLKSPALKSDLMMRRKALTNMLNDAVGANVITDISFI